MVVLRPRLVSADSRLTIEGKSSFLRARFRQVSRLLQHFAPITIDTGPAGKGQSPNFDSGIDAEVTLGSGFNNPEIQCGQTATDNVPIRVEVSTYGDGRIAVT